MTRTYLQERGSVSLTRVFLSTLLILPLASTAMAQTFEVASVNADGTVIVLENDSGDTITVTGTSSPEACFESNSVGRVGLRAGVNDPVCDQTVSMTFQSSGFLITEIEFLGCLLYTSPSPRD